MNRYRLRETTPCVCTSYGKSYPRVTGVYVHGVSFLFFLSFFTLYYCSLMLSFNSTSSIFHVLNYKYIIKKSYGMVRRASKSYWQR